MTPLPRLTDLAPCCGDPGDCGAACEEGRAEFALEQPYFDAEGNSAPVDEVLA